MPEQTPDTSTAPPTASSSAPHPPLSARAGAAGERRLQKEQYVRGLGIGKDETSAAGVLYTIAVYGIRLTLMALGLYGRGVRNARNLCLERRDIPIPDLPESLEGFRILHISDFHFPKRYPEFAAAVGELLRGVEVDLCAITGDYRYGYFGTADHIAAHLTAALAGVSSRHGMYAVLGNHDHFNAGELLETSGIPVLYNEGMLLQHDQCPVWLCGIDEPHFYKCDDLDSALRGRPEHTFTILLAHSPERIAQAEAKGVSLYLAGHTHGGQIRFPLIGALVANARCTYEQVWGAWRHNNMAGHTTSGIGATDVPVRYNCPPEAVLLTLRRAHCGE